MIVILVSKLDGVIINLGFFNTAGYTGQVVRSFVEVYVVQIVFPLKDVLLHALETEKPQDLAKQRSHRGHSDGEIDFQSPPHLYSGLACITTYNVHICWLRVGQCELCVLCGAGLWEWDSKVVGVKLFAFRLKKLGESQTLIRR